MNTLLANRIGAILAAPSSPRDVLYESALRVAADTLQRAKVDDVSATTVLGIVGADDQPAFEALVQQIASDCGAEVRIRWHGQSFSVRFTRRLVAQAPATGPLWWTGQ